MNEQQRKAIELALEALYENTQYSMRGDPITYQDQRNDDAIEGIKEVLMSLCDGAQPAVAEQHKQEPVAKLFGTLLVYDTSQRTWVGLTDEEIDELFEYGLAFEKPRDIYREIEDKLKEKNT